MSVKKVIHEKPVFLKGRLARYKVNSSVSVELNGIVQTFSFTIFYPNYYRGERRLDWNYTDLKRQISLRFPSSLYRRTLGEVIKKMGNELVSFEKELLNIEKKKKNPKIKVSNVYVLEKNENFEVEFYVLGLPYLFKQSLFYNQGKWNFFSLYVLKEDSTWSSFTETPSLFFNESIEKQLVSFIETSRSAVSLNSF